MVRRGHHAAGFKGASPARVTNMLAPQPAAPAAAAADPQRAAVLEEAVAAVVSAALALVLYLVAQSLTSYSAAECPT